MTERDFPDGSRAIATPNGLRQIIKAMAEVIIPTPVPSPAVFSTPFGDVPDDTDGYLILRDTISVIGSLNGLEERPLTDGEISGKRVVIQRESRPHTDYNGRNDLRKLVIIAETLEVRSPLHLPQTTVEIYARRVTFSGDGSVVTQPAANTMTPGPQADGSPGLSAGSLLLFAEAVDWPVSRPTPPFILRGASGQQAGPGRAPQPGDSMPTLPTKVINGQVIVDHGDPELGWCGVGDLGSNFRNAIVYYQTYKFGSGPVTRGEKRWPGNGTAGIPGGKPGEGGAGGDAISNLPDLSSMVDNSGGDAGAAYVDVLTPGAPGTPNPAYHVYACAAGGIPDHAERHDAQPGPPATSPKAAQPQGMRGQIKIAGDPLAWVQPRNIEAVLQYAEDLYLSRRATEAGRFFAEYADIVARALASSPDGDNAPALGQLLRRLKQRQAQVALGMDYYGNPPGWVPLLSLEVTIGIYSAELDRAAKALYLNFWFTRKIGDATTRAAALDLLLKAAQDHLAATIKDLNTLLTERIPKLQDALDGIVRDQDFLAQKLKLREEQLRVIADSHAEEAERARQALGAMHLFAAVLTLVPVIQPAGAILGASLEGIANRSDLWTIVKSAGTAYFTSAGYTQDFNALIAGIKGLDFSSYDTLQTSIDAIPTGSTVSRGTIIRDAGSAVYSRATDLLGEKASDTVPADLASQLLAQYEATDPEYQGYISDAKALLLKKQETFAQLQDLQQQTAAKAQDVARHMATIEALVKPLRDAKLAIDTPVLAAVADLRRDAERRLRYYLYLIALAYEYRLLQPYRSPLNVNLDVKQLQNAADANQTELTTDQARDLMVPYEKVLSQITEEIINAYDLQQKPIEQQLTRSIRLSDNECTRLGKGERVEINLALRPEFAGLTQENLRLVGVALESMNGIEAKPASVDVLMRHEGVSLIKAGTTIHGFRHLGYDGQAFLNWRSNYDFKTDVIHNSTPSEAAESLLLSRLNTPSDKFVLFASPGLDAGLVLSLEPSSVRLQLSEVVFSVHYTYQQT